MKDMHGFNSEQNMEERLLHSLLDLNHMMRMLYEGKASQSRILIILYEQGEGVSQKELTEYLKIQPGSASEILSKLERSGLIVRTQSKADRRSMEIALTETGKEQAREAIAKRKKRHEQMFACLTQEEKEAFGTILSKMSEDWKKRFFSLEVEGKVNGEE